MPYIDTQKLREILDDNPGRVAAEKILSLCDALEETPDQYGFEFITEPDGFVGGESSREDYYFFRYPQEKLPENFTARVYLRCPDHGSFDEGSEIAWYNGFLVDERGGRMADSDDDHRFPTLVQCVAWLNEQIGGTIICKEPE